MRKISFFLIAIIYSLDQGGSFAFTSMLFLIDWRRLSPDINENRFVLSTLDSNVSKWPHHQKGHFRVAVPKQSNTYPMPEAAWKWETHAETWVLW